MYPVRWRRQSPVMEQVGAIHLTWKRSLQRGLNRHRINLKQVFLLRQLAERGFLHPSEIAEMLFCDRPTATVIIGNLERRGWVQRERDPDDGKRSRVSITNAGRRKLRTVPQRAYRTGKTDVDPLACFGAGELTELEKLLEKLIGHLQSVVSQPPASGKIQAGTKRRRQKNRRRRGEDGEQRRCDREP